jgi:hypothetical protein
MSQLLEVQVETYPISTSGAAERERRLAPAVMPCA